MSGGRRSGANGSSSKRSGNHRPRGRDERLRSRTAAAEEDASQQTAPTRHDGLVCACCSQMIANTDDHVIVTPCNHELCTLCMIRSHASRGRLDHCCPVASCNNRTTTGCRFMSSRSERETLTNTVDYDNADDKLVRDNFPIESLVRNHTNDLIDDPNGEAFVIFAARATINNQQLDIKSIVSTHFLSEEDVKNKDESSKLIGQFGAFIHPLITKPSRPTHRHRPVLSPRELLEYRTGNMRLIDSLLYGLTTGNSCVDKEKILTPGNQDYQSKFLSAAVVASDVIMRGCVSYPLELQLMLKEVFNRQKLTTECHSLLSALFLAPCKTYSMKKRHNEVVNKMRKGIQPGPRDLVLILFDNIGYKILGRQASYDQWVVVNIVWIKEEDLKKLGFYIHDNDPDKQISRQASVDWKEEIKACGDNATMKKELAKKVVGITDEDNDKVAECIMHDILVAVENKDKLLSGYGENLKVVGVGTELPRLDLIIDSKSKKAMEERLERRGCGEDVTDNNPGTNILAHVDVMPRDEAPTNVENEIGGNVLARNVRDNDDNEEETEEEIEEDEGGDDEKKIPRNRYTVNNTSLQAVKADLNKTQTVEMLMKYATDSRQLQLQRWENEKESYSDTAEPPVAQFINPLGTDGQPAKQAWNILREDNGHNFPKETFVSFGGLHTVMKTLNANGELFEPLMREVVSAIRDTLPKQDWFLFVSDPRQREYEYPLLALAHYLVASHEFHPSKPSAKEVHEFMLKKGAEYSTCAFALLELRMGAIAKMMRNSERLGKEDGVQLFFTVLKFALRLFTLTHKTDYISLGCDLLLWYYCASPAQRKIYDNLIFTLTTVNGKSVFHDYFVECSVMDMRELSGKIFYQGLGADLEHLAASLPERESTSNRAQQLRDKGSKSRASDRYRYVVDDRLERLVKMITKMKLWKRDEAPVVRGEKTDTTVECHSDVIMLPRGVKLPSLTLSSIMDTGSKRLEDYFIEYYIDNFGSVKRSEKGLGKLKTSLKDLKAAMELEKTLATTTNKQDLKPREYKKALILKEIDIMTERDKKREKAKQVNIPKHDFDNSTRKDTIVDFLTKWRIREFKKFPNLRREVEEGLVKRRNDSNNVLPSFREDLMKSDFFSLENHINAHRDIYE